MAISYYLVRGQSFTRQDTLADVPDDGEDISWAHAVAPTAEEIDRVLDAVDASLQVREAIHDLAPHPEFFVSEGAAFLSYPVQVPGEWSREYLLFVRHGRCLLTVSRRPLAYLEEFCQKVEDHGAEDANYPLNDLFASTARADRDALQAMRDSVDGLDARLEDDPRSITIQDIRSLKNAVLRCGNICEDQAFCLAAMNAPAAAKVVGDAKTSTRASLLTLVRYIDRSFNRLDARARELEAQLLMTYQKKTEDRLRILTVISAIFSPLTVLAGIYGMNFEVIPELSFPHAYFIALGAMAALATGMLFYFQQRGWLAPSR